MTVVGCLTQLVVERSSVFKAPPVAVLLLEMQLCGFFLFLLPEMVESSIEPSHVAEFWHGLVWIHFAVVAFVCF